MKLLERIEPVDAGGVTALTSTGNAAFFTYANGSSLGWKLTPNGSGCAVSATTSTPLRIVLDIREQYDSPGMGREYVISPEMGGALVSYRDKTMDATTFIHLRCKEEIRYKGEWVEVAYPRDAARNSEPSKLYAYVLGESTSTLLAFGYGITPEEARKQSAASSKQRVSAPRVGADLSHDTLMAEVTTARVSVAQSLRWLQAPDGIWAGLPWFHQVWSRDELIAALGFSRAQQLELIRSYLGKELINGELPTFLGSGTTCADGVAWLCLLIKEYGAQSLPAEEKTRLIHFLERARAGLLETRTARHGLIYSGHNATWMDTIGREGYRIEIQAGYALMLSLLYELTGAQAYSQEHASFLGRIREYYWRRGYLADGLNDDTIRPNVFLAYLLEPEILSETLWLHCFDAALNALRLEWGGLSSVDTSDSRFHATSTGQNNLSYHNGDSWFFVNNMSAVAMHRLNGRRYSHVITGILQSSTHEILWHNLAGHPGEISSAGLLDSWGCGIQAFSGGPYLWLLAELETQSAHGKELINTFWDSTNASTSSTFFS